MFEARSEKKKEEDPHRGGEEDPQNRIPRKNPTCASLREDPAKRGGRELGQQGSKKEITEQEKHSQKTCDPTSGRSVHNWNTLCKANWIEESNKKKGRKRQKSTLVRGPLVAMKAFQRSSRAWGKNHKAPAIIWAKRDRCPFVTRKEKG